MDAAGRRDEARGQTIKRKSGRAALLLLLALLVLAMTHLRLDLDESLLVGVGGGLLACLLIVGLDVLHSFRVRSAREGHAALPGDHPANREPAGGDTAAARERPVTEDGR